MLTNKANNKKPKLYRRARTAAKQRDSCSTSTRNSIHPQSPYPCCEHSHLQQLAQTHYNQKLTTLKRYVEGISKMGILETSIRNSPNTSLAQTSERRHIALQSENQFYVEKINMLQEDIVRKNKKITEMGFAVKNIQFQRKQFNNQKHSLKKMIQLLNRENKVLKKAMKIPVSKTDNESDKENKKTQL